jgi:hypothetical protein
MSRNRAIRGGCPEYGEIFQEQKHLKYSRFLHFLRKTTNWHAACFYLFRVKRIADRLVGRGNTVIGFAELKNTITGARRWERRLASVIFVAHISDDTPIPLRYTSHSPQPSHFDSERIHESNTRIGRRLPSARFWNNHPRRNQSGTQRHAPLLQAMRQRGRCHP